MSYSQRKENLIPYPNLSVMRSLYILHLWILILCQLYKDRRTTISVTRVTFMPGVVVRKQRLLQRHYVSTPTLPHIQPLVECFLTQKVNCKSIKWFQWVAGGSIAMWILESGGIWHLFLCCICWFNIFGNNLSKTCSYYILIWCILLLTMNF